MKPKEVAALTGLKERTIRFYVEEGLVSPATREQNGRTYRDYSQEDVNRLRTIATLRKAGFTLEELRAMLVEDRSAEEVYPAYLARIRQEAETSRALLEAAEQVSPAGLDAEELALRLSRSAESLSLPQADLEPHFRYLDELEPAPPQVPYHRDARPMDLDPETMFIHRPLGMKQALDDVKRDSAAPVSGGMAGPAPVGPLWLRIIKGLAILVFCLFVLSLLVSTGWLSNITWKELRFHLPVLGISGGIALGIHLLQKLYFAKRSGA